MRESGTIQSHMTICPHTIGLEQHVSLARKIMQKHSIHHLPVQTGHRLVGVISDRDIKFVAAWAKDQDQDFSIKDVYTPDPYVVSPTTPLAEALRKMVAEQLGCVLIEAEGKVVGIFTMTDACRVLADMLDEKESEV